jgi:hypothetical protein
VSTRAIFKPRRPAAERVPGCTEPGWSVQQRILESGPLLATCQGCGAVRKTEGAR